jgi:hypothetical protein
MDQGTIDPLHSGARDVAEVAIKRLTAGMLEAMRVRCEVDHRRPAPCLVNDDRILGAVDSCHSCPV